MLTVTQWILVLVIVALAIHIVLPAPPAHAPNAIYDWWRSLWASTPRPTTPPATP